MTEAATKPLSKKITQEIREILEDSHIERTAANRRHPRFRWTHTLKGWKRVLEPAKCWENVEYAIATWQLTYHEASGIFVHSTGYRQQFAILKHLESGKRVNTAQEMLALINDK